MIPNIDDDLLKNIEIEEQPTHTYELQMYKDKIGNYSDGLEAMKQAIYHILSTERYQHVIYSWNYGVELADLFGKPINYCISEVKRRIKEALVQDTRIEDVNNFEFSNEKGNIFVRFKVITIFGDIDAEKVVKVR